MGFGMITKRKAVLLAIMLVALGLRMYMLAEKEFGVDERFQQYLITGSFEHLLSVYLKEEPNNPMLHGIVTHFIYHLFGSYYFVKLFSVICGLASIFLCYKIANKLFNEDFALLATALLAFNPLHIFYSQHTRAYIMVLFLFTLFFYELLIFIKNYKERKHAIALALISTIFLYTHYIAIIILLCTAAFFTHLWRKHKIDAKSALIPLVIAATLFIPQAFVLALHPALVKSVAYKRSVLDLPYVFYKFANGANISFLMSGYAPLLFIAFLVNTLFALGLFQMFKEKSAHKLFIFFFFLPFLLVALATIKVSHFFYFRNFTYLLPLFVMPIAYYIASLRNNYLKLVLVAAIVIGWLAIVTLYYSVVTMPDWNVYIGL